MSAELSLYGNRFLRLIEFSLENKEIERLYMTTVLIE
jgi:hypothetical protein